MINWKRKASILNQISRKLPKGFILFSSSTLLAKKYKFGTYFAPLFGISFQQVATAVDLVCE